MARILLTGAAGFIGSQVLRHIKTRHEVLAIDNLTDFSNYEMKLSRLADILGNKATFDDEGKLNSNEVNFIQLDILNEQLLDNIFQKYQFDLVIHLAAMTGIRQSVAKPDIYEKVNVRGFFNLIECCRKYNVKNFLFASSSSVYGNCKDVPFTENSNTDTPLNLYAATKKMNELVAHCYASLYQMQCIGLRFFTVYGPWARPDMATHTFIKSIINGTPIKLFNQGNMQRDFTYVGDIVASIDLLINKMMASPLASSIPYKIFNIGGGNPVNLKQYVEAIESLLGKKAIIESHELQKGEMQNTYADCSALAEYIGFKPQTDFRQGLAATVNWYKNYSNIL